MSAPPPGTDLCALADIADPGAKGCVFGEGVARFELFVVRKGERVYGYVNACPHAGTPLDLLPDRFLTATKDLLFCSTHGARFRLDDGHCVSGPCKGQNLKAFPVTVLNGRVLVA